MLSKKAINWLKENDYKNHSHEDRMILIAAAKILYPPTEAEMEAEHLFENLFR